MTFSEAHLQSEAHMEHDNMNALNIGSLTPTVPLASYSVNVHRMENFHFHCEWDCLSLLSALPREIFTATATGRI